MKIVVIAEYNEMDAYQEYIQALVDDQKEDIAPVAEVMLESMKQARRHPEHIETETDGFGTFEVQTTEYGGCEFRASYDAETVAEIIGVMTRNRDTVEQIVRWLHSGLKIFKGISGMFKEMFKLISDKRAEHQQEQEREVVW